MSYRRKFTFMELVAVLVVAAVLLSVTAPRFSAFAHGRRAEEEAMRFLAVTRMAAARAVSEGRSLSLQMSPAENSFSIFFSSGYLVDDEEIWQIDENIVVLQISEQRELLGDGAIVFHPDGRVEGVDNLSWIFQGRGQNVGSEIYWDSQLRRFQLNPEVVEVTR